MMDTNVSRQRKESTLPLDQTSLPTPDIKLITDDSAYPFAMALRLRVLQIVCGISLVVMGTVAFIEERGQVNLGLGMPAGIFTVIAAGVSVHTSRGFSGYKEGNCPARLRFLGPRTSVAIPLTLLWSAACILQAALIILSTGQLIIGDAPSTITNNNNNNNNNSNNGGKQLSILAALLLTLSSITLIAVLALLRIDCRYDPD